jgi:dipeptidase E
VGGGEVFYLCFWMWRSGLADLLPTLRREAVYVGLSAGSMVVTPPIGVFDDPQLHDPQVRDSRSDRLLGLVDFTLLPHLGSNDLPERSLADAESWAAGTPIPAYAIDDQTAIEVVDGAVNVISEGSWKLFTQE